uniref:Uncharacterized protein n=1 Tax=viral metagenome TaxID=1070528 RepID=A0A6C0BKC7_9ZZZZ
MEDYQFTSDFTSQEEQLSVTGFIQFIRDSIQVNDNESVAEGLVTLDLEQTSKQDVVDLIGQFLYDAAVTGNNEVIPIILNRWDSLYPDDKTDIITRLVMERSIDTAVVQFAINSIPDASFVDVVNDLSQLPEDENQVLYVRRAFELFGEQDPQVLQTLRESAQYLQNEYVSEALRQVLAQHMEFAPIPSWVGDYGLTIDVLPSMDRLMKSVEIETDATNEELVELLLKSLSDQVEVLERARVRAEMLRYFNNAPESERNSLIRPILREQFLLAAQNDSTLFRLLGPANAMTGSNEDQLSMGGCRMLTCAVYDYNDEDQYYENWFVGSCLSCDKRIRSCTHALRIPMAAGGWVGCYCSEPCASMGISELETANDDDGASGLIMRTKLELVIRQLEEFGIQNHQADDLYKISTERSIVPNTELEDDLSSTMTSLQYTASIGTEILDQDDGSQFFSQFIGSDVGMIKVVTSNLPGSGISTDLAYIGEYTSDPDVIIPSGFTLQDAINDITLIPVDASYLGLDTLQLEGM